MARREPDFFVCRQCKRRLPKNKKKRHVKELDYTREEINHLREEDITNPICINCVCSNIIKIIREA
jgi:hypothetical protein